MFNGVSSGTSTPLVNTPKSTPSTPISSSFGNIFPTGLNILGSNATEQTPNVIRSKGISAWQVCPGSINPYPQAFTWSTFMGDEVIAFASGRHVMIYCGNSFVQLLDGHDENVTSVKWSNLHGRIAACSRGKIVIYAPIEEEIDNGALKKSPSWLVEQVINSNDEFECMDWNFYGDRLIVGGKTTMIFEGKPSVGNQTYKWNMVWKYENPTPIYLVAFSPDEKYFATVSKFDRLVKVWYRNKPQIRVTLFTPVITIVDPISTSQTIEDEEEESFSYIYLPHPRSVTSISWRFKDIQSQQRDEFTANVLLTTSIDNVVRVWSETNENEDLSFYVCSIIEKETPSNVQWLNTANEKSPNELLLQYLRKKRKKSYEGDHKDIILENEAKISLETKLQKASSDTGLFESQTWLGTVQSDGTLMIDLLQGLADFPRRTPKTSMWIKMPNALKGIEDPLNVSMVYKTADDSNLDLGSTTPKILTIYVQSRNGMLSSWELNLAKRPQLELLNVFTGHVGDVNSMECHPSLPIMASLDRDNNHLVAWHVRDTPFYSPKDVLTNIQDFQINATNISWFPTSPHLFCSTNKGIEVIHVKSVNPLTHNLSSIYESTIFPPSPSYYNIHSLNFVLPNSEEFSDSMFLKVLPFGTSPTGPEKTSTVGALVVAIASNGKTIGIFQVETKPNDVNQFECSTIIKQNLEKTVCSADCVKGVPFIYDMHKSKTALSSESSIKKYFANQRVIVITLGNIDGSVSVIRLKKQENEIKEVPKPKIGGLLGKFTTTSNSSSSSTTSSEEKLILQKWYEFKAEKEPITAIKCCELVSRIATTTSSSNNVRIWENESHVTYTLEQSISTETDIVCNFEWLSYGDGQFVLCIGTDSKILYYTQSKIPPGIFKQQKQYWKRVTQFIPSVKGQPCSKISVTKDKAIVASFGSSLHVYTKTQQNDDSLALMSLFKLTSEPSLHTESLLTHRRLVDYHPNFLLELLMDGRFSLIKTIIHHLVKHLKIYEELVEKKKSDKVEEYLNKDKDYSNLLEIPSIKVTSLIKEESKKSEPVVQKRRTLLDKFTNIDEEIAKEEDGQKKEPETETEEEINIYSDVQYLNTLLSKTSIHLPGISKAEQMNLQAVVDTFVELQRNPEALDPSGIRYLVTVKYLQFLYAKRKPETRDGSKNVASDHDNLLIEKVNSSMIAWALLSETQDSLWRMICPEEEDISWKLVEQLGVCYWMNNNSLKKVAERLATEIYKETNDPTKCALYYMAIKKKGALARLFKLKGNEKVAEFLNKDFSDEKCRVAASKNAYTLLSRQDYFYAAAYFLLADNPKDAISILIKSAKEYDLAFFIARLYCGDDSNFCKNMLENDLYQRYTETKDVWMQSIILWTLKKYERSIETLIKRGEENEVFDPSLFAFCIKVDSKPHLNSSDLVAKHALPILLRTAHYYSQVGLYTLCLEHLLKLKNMDQYTSKRKLNTSIGQNDLMSGQINMGAFGTPKITSSIASTGGGNSSGNLSSGTLSGFGEMGMGGMNSGNLSSGTLSGFGGMGNSMTSGNLSSGTLSGFGGMGGMNSGNLSSGTLSGFGGMGGMGNSMTSGNLSSGTLSGFGMNGMGMGNSMKPSGNLSSGTLSGFGGMGMGGMNSGNLSSGTLGGFGMNGMGMGNSINSGNLSSGTKQQPHSSNISLEDAKEQTDLTQLIKFKTALTIISQELYDCCYRTNSNYHSDWDKNHKKIMTDIDELVVKLDIDKQMLIKKLKVFTRVNGLLAARCLLCSKPNSIIRVLESFVYQIENTLSLVIKNQLKKSQVNMLEGLLKEYVYCYSRMKSNKVIITEHQQSDLSSTLLTIMFVILYFNRDFEGLLTLFTLHQDFDKKERDSLSTRSSFEGKEVFDKFYHLLFDRMTMFHKKFKKKMLDNKINKAMQEEIEQEEKRKKKAPVNKTAGLIINKEEAEKKKDYYKNLLENYHNKTTKSGSDRNEDAERIEKQFHWEMFDAFVVFKFTTTLKDFIEHAYDETYSGFVKQSQKKRDDINKQQYSLCAQTALSCSALWCSHLERRLQYREMEVYTVSEHAVPNLKDVNALSTRNNLSSMVETLSHGGSKKMHQRTQSSKDHFHSLAHALPELGLEQVGGQQNLLLSCISEHWLEDEKMFDTFKTDSTSQQLWSYLMDLSSKPKPNISSSVSVNSSLAKFASDATESTSEFSKSESDEILKFSADIEIVKCKELIKSFCVDSNNPSYLAYASGKCIREINIEHSIRYRKRNPSLDKLLDEEAITWDQSFHRFDDIAAKDVNNTKFVQQSSSIAKVPSISNFNVFDFLDTVNDDEAMSNKNLKKFIGFSNPMSSVDSSNSYMNKLKQRFSVGKRPSFTTTTPSASHFRRQSNIPPSKQPVKKVGKIDRNQTANVLVSHPFLPFYISGGADGSVYMWQYGFQYALRTYREPGTSPITNIRFSRFGYKFGVTDTSGYLTLWRFEASKESLHYFYHLHCHGSKVNDFSFLESGSLIATIGQSPKGGELCIWDLFLPNQDAKMFYYLFPNNDEPLALRYSYKYKLLLVGTKKGDIYIFDAEDGSYGFLQKASTQHDSIQVLNIDVTEDFFVTGCSNGHITVWDMKNLKKQLYFYPDTHPKKKLFTQEGVTWSEISTQFFYTSGGDGRIIRKTIV